MNWIKVEERLPKQDVWVVAMADLYDDGYYQPFIAYHETPGLWWSKEGSILANVKAWFALPEFNPEDL